ncbi:MAG: hypothetical protein KC609_07805 [Myxococcales bacterium]|nr:hypothetical protein [Myxococcales bacterium]
MSRHDSAPRRLVNRPGEPIRFETEPAPTNLTKTPLEPPSHAETQIEAPSRAETQIEAPSRGEPQIEAPSRGETQLQRANRAEAERALAHVSELASELVAQLQHNQALRLELALLERENAYGEQRRAHLEATVDGLTAVLVEAVRLREKRLALRHRFSMLAWWRWRERRQLRNQLLAMQ